MALINIQTDLKSLKYSQFGTTPPPIIKSIDQARGETTGLDLQVTKRVDDLTRITKLLATPSGIKFVGNQTMLQQLQVKIDNPDRKLGGRLLSGGWNTAKQIASTLAQIPVNGTGTHFVEAFAGKQGYVKGVASHTETLNTSGFYDRDKINVQSKFETLTDIPTATNTNSRILRKYLSVGNNTENPSQTYQDFLVRKNIQGFIGKSAINYESEMIKDVDSPDDAPKEFYTTAGEKTKGLSNVRLNQNFGFGEKTTYKNEKGEVVELNPYDAISARVPIRGPLADATNQGIGEKLTPDQGAYFDDIIDFNFKIISPRSNADEPEVTILFFRAFLDSFDDKYAASWSGQKYIGRAEELYNYESFSRDISFSFKVAAMSKAEVMPLYKKLNLLAGHLAPTYGQSKFMKGNLVTVTVGDYIKNQPGFISSIGLTWNPDYPFQTSANENDLEFGDKQLPMVLDVSVAFRPIHTFAPAYGENFILNDPSAYKGTTPNAESASDEEETVTTGNNEQY